MIDELVPGSVAAVEAFADPPEAVLYAEEEAVVARAVDKRRREFTTARHCARTALGRLGIAGGPILPGPKGAPQWPTGVVGSMTHCAGYRAAALAHARDVVTIGIDAEPHEPLPAGILTSIATAQERDLLAALAAEHPTVSWDRLLFCAKEAVYKAWFPLTGRWLDFHEAAVTFDPAGRTFAARLLVPWPPESGPARSGFDGRFLVEAGLALTAIVVPTSR